jgi:ammonium transporter, Amt family
MVSANFTSVSSACEAEFADDLPALITCISNNIESNFQSQTLRSDNWLLVLSGSLLFLMQLGFSMMSAGSVRRKNSANLLLNNVLDTCVVAMGFFTLGYAFAFGSEENNGETTFVGTKQFFLS